MIQTPQPNKHVILQAKLAVERTVMANDRTFLSFIRSSLYFVVAGLTLNQLVSIRYGYTIAVVALITGLVLFLAGLYKYVRQLKNIKASRRIIEE